MNWHSGAFLVSGLAFIGLTAGALLTPDAKEKEKEKHDLQIASGVFTVVHVITWIGAGTNESTKFVFLVSARVYFALVLGLCGFGVITYVGGNMFGHASPKLGKYHTNV